MISAPVIWIFLPMVAALLLWFIPRKDVTAGLGSGLTLILGLGAWLLPFDTPLGIGNISIKITSVLEILGRRFIFSPADTILLAIVYFSVSFWFMASVSAQASNRMIPIGLLITAFLVASLAVEPFLYAALLIEMAVLISMPLLSTLGRAPSRGATRFLIFQTLSMPIILFAGWLIAGVEANPGDLIKVSESAVLLGLGLMFLLAIFPFVSWIPMLAEETHPYIAGFIFWIFPTFTLFFGLKFLENYAWLRESPELIVILRGTGSLMVVIGGFWAAFQHHAARMLGNATIIEIGFSLLAISLGSPLNIDLFFLLMIPRALSIGLWSISLSTLERSNQSLWFQDIRGLGRSKPFAALGLLIASLTMLGLPLLPKFSIILSLWLSVAEQSLLTVIWIALGVSGLAIGVIRTLGVLVISSPGESWKSEETRSQRFFIGIGGTIMFVLGLIPQWIQSILVRLPSIFEHLGR